MTEELEVLRIVTGRLDSARVPYMVTGSIAASYYAVPRMTRDIDLVVELAAGDVDRLYALFADEFYLDRDAVREAIESKGAFNLIHHAHVIKVDLIVRKDSDYRRTEFERRQRAVIDDHDFAIVAPEDLILSKLDWARHTRSDVQLGDVRNLVASVADLDRQYLAIWTERLDLVDLYREVGG